jgi:sugar phosphate isomerase/epimerase
LDLLHKRIALVAVKDLAWEQVDDVDERLGKKRWRTRIVPLAHGAVPWPEVFGYLREAKFDGWVSVHSEYQGSHSWRDLNVAEVLQQTREDLEYLGKVLPDANVPRPAGMK